MTTIDLKDVNVNMPFPWQIKYDSTLGEYYYYNEVEDTVSFDSPCEVQTHLKNISATTTSKSRFFLSIRKSVRANETFCPISIAAGLPMKRKMISRITTALSMKSSRSDKSESSTLVSTKSTPSTTSNSTFIEHNSPLFEMKKTRRSVSPPVQYSSSPSSPSSLTPISGTNDAFLVANYQDYKNFAGTSMFEKRSKKVPTGFSESASIELMEEASFYSDLEDYPFSEEESVRSFHMDESNYTFKSPKYEYNDYHYSYSEAEEVDIVRPITSPDEMENERRQLRLQMFKEMDF